MSITRAMRICLVSREFPPFYGGGIGTYVLQAARALTLAGHRVVVLTVSSDGSRSSESMPVWPVGDCEEHFHVERVPLVMGDDWSRPAPSIADEATVAAFTQLGPTSAFSWQVARALPEIVERHGIEIVEGPECGAPLWWTLHERRCGLAWQGVPSGHHHRYGGSGPKFVVHLHSPNAWIDWLNRHVARKRAAIEIRDMERESAQMADLVIAPSHDLAAWCARAWRLDDPSATGASHPRTGRVQVVPYPVGTIGSLERSDLLHETIDRLPEHAAEGPEGGDGSGFGNRVAEGVRTERAERGLRVLFAGRLEPRKGVDLLMGAFVAATRLGATMTLDIAGEDSWDGRRGTFFARRSLLTLVPPGLRDRVTLHGKLTQERLALLRGRSDVFAAPGAFDNFPYTVIEAMAVGMPVLAPRYGGASELVRDGVDGVLFDAHDTRTCAEALLRLSGMSEASRREMGRSGAARVQAFCSNERAVREREKVFGALLARALPVRSEPAFAPVARPSDTNDDDEILVHGGGSADDHAMLRDALLSSGVHHPIGFAIGWTRSGSTGHAIAARGALTPETVALAGRCGDPVGPIALRRSVCERIGPVGPFGSPIESTAGSVSGLELVHRLMAAGVSGIALPHLITLSDASGDREGAADACADVLESTPPRSIDVPGVNVAMLGPAIASWREVPFPWRVVTVEGSGRD